MSLKITLENSYSAGNTSLPANSVKIFAFNSNPNPSFKELDLKIKNISFGQIEITRVDFKIPTSILPGAFIHSNYNGLQESLKKTFDAYPEPTIGAPTIDSNSNSNSNNKYITISVELSAPTSINHNGEMTLNPFSLYTNYTNNPITLDSPINISVYRSNDRLISTDFNIVIDNSQIGTTSNAQPPANTAGNTASNSGTPLSTGTTSNPQPPANTAGNTTSNSGTPLSTGTTSNLQPPANTAGNTTKTPPAVTTLSDKFSFGVIGNNYIINSKDEQFIDIYMNVKDATAASPLTITNTSGNEATINFGFFTNNNDLFAPEPLQNSLFIDTAGGLKDNYTVEYKGQNNISGGTASDSVFTDNSTNGGAISKMDKQVNYSNRERYFHAKMKIAEGNTVLSGWYRFRIKIKLTNDTINYGLVKLIIQLTIDKKTSTYEVPISVAPFNIANNGNVGIGTVNPAKKLDVTGDAHISGVTTLDGNMGIGSATPTTAKLVIGGNPNNDENGLDLSSANQIANVRVLQNTNYSSDKDMYFGYLSGTNSSLHLYSNNSETMTIKNGNVGIGTTSPLVKAEISSNSNDILKITSTIGNSGNTSNIAFNTYTGNGIGSRIKAIDNGICGNHLAFETGNGNGVVGTQITTERMRITDSGNVGIGTDSPSSKLQVNGRIKDQTGFVMPVGSIIAYYGASAPDGWLMCDGTTEVNSTTHSELYTLLGGVGTIKTPNLCGRTLIGTSSKYAKGQIGGTETHKLSIDEMPKHNHTPANGTGFLTGSANGVTGYEPASSGSGFYGNIGSNATTKEQGSDTAHNNMQPYMAVHYIIKY